MKGINSLEILLLASLMIASVISSSINIPECGKDEDCLTLPLCESFDACTCKDGQCEFRIPANRPRWRRSTADMVANNSSDEILTDDIGPDTCDKDRQVLSNWYCFF